MTDLSPARPSETTTIAQLLQEVVDLTAGAVTVLLPIFILAVPAIGLVIVPVIALGAILAIVGLLVALPLLPPYLLIRAIRRRRVARAGRTGERRELALRVHARPTPTH